MPKPRAKILSWRTPTQTIAAPSNAQSCGGPATVEGEQEPPAFKHDARARNDSTRRRTLLVIRAKRIFGEHEIEKLNASAL